MFLFRIRKNKLFRTGAVYGSASLLKSGATMIAGIVMIRWLDPEQIGLWQSLTVLMAYTSFPQLGINQGLNRELPFLYGQDKTEKGNYLASSAQAYMSYLSLLFVLITLIIGFVFLIQGKPIKLISGIFILGFMISLNTFNNFLSVTYRTAKAFDKLAKVFFIDTILIIGILPIIYFYNYYGLLVYNLVSVLILSILMFSARPLKIKNNLDFKNIWELIKTGAPIFAMGYIKQVSRSFIRLVLLNAGGIRLVGLFAPVSAVSNIMTVFPTIFANFFYPQMTYRFGKTGDPKTLWPTVKKTYIILFVVSIPLVVCIWFVTPFLITNYFEKYKESIYAIQIMAISLSFSGGRVTHNLFYSIKAYKYSYVYTGIELLLYAIVPIFFVDIFSNKLTGISYAVLLISISTFIINIILLRQALFNPKFLVQIENNK